VPTLMVFSFPREGTYPSAKSSNWTLACNAKPPGAFAPGG